MAASASSGAVPAWEDRYKWIAGRIVEHLSATRPKPDGYVPGALRPAGQDVPRPQGLYTRVLIWPGEWPEVSESKLAEHAQAVRDWARHQEDSNRSAKAHTDEVFGTDWTAGEARDAAFEHYEKEWCVHDRVVEAGEAVAASVDRVSEFTGLIKGKMRQAHDEWHREIERMLRLSRVTGAPVGIGPLTAEYRPLIAGWSAELHGYTQDQTAMLTDKFGAPEAPAGRISGHDSDDPMPTDKAPHGDPQDAESGAKKAATTAGRALDALPTDSANGTPPKNALTAPNVGGPMDALPTPTISGAPSITSQPKMPSMPSMPSSGGGSGSSPLSGLGGGMGGLQGMFGKGLTGPLGNVNPAALQGPSSAGMSPASLGTQFGKGLSMGSGAAGAMPPITSAPAVPQTPTTPLAAPLNQASAPAAAAPAGGLTAPSSNAAGAGAPAVAGGGMPAGATPPMTSYGSVLPPSAIPPAAASGAGGPASIGGAPSPPPVTGNAGAASTTGFMPVREQAAPQPIARSVSMSDLELARAAVADLAAASSVVYPGLEWAVAVSRGGTSGLPELWVTSNEGAGYIPAGVYLRRTMPLAARFDEDFDARWFGWFNPAETVLRAVRARGETVSAIATTWPQKSEFVSDAAPDVAIAVAPSSTPADAESSQLLSSRSHRLETVAPGVYRYLEGANQDVAEAYARQLTQEAAFRGPELSSVAQSVARTLISSRWPSAEEWSALRSEYEVERLMAGSQRPGLTGMEEPAQLVAYVQDFVHCRRLETLVCWENGTPADVVYAAAMAGVSLDHPVSV